MNKIAKVSKRQLDYRVVVVVVVIVVAVVVVAAIVIGALQKIWLYSQFTTRPCIAVKSE